MRETITYSRKSARSGKTFKSKRSHYDSPSREYSTSCRTYDHRRCRQFTHANIVPYTVNNRKLLQKVFPSVFDNVETGRNVTYLSRVDRHLWLRQYIEIQQLVVVLLFRVRHGLRRRVPVQFKRYPGSFSRRLTPPALQIIYVKHEPTFIIRLIGNICWKDTLQ